MKPNETFAEFLHRKFDPDREWQYHIDTSITPQSNYLVDLNGELIVDFIGHYETLQQDFDHCCKTIGIPKVELPPKEKQVIDLPIVSTTPPKLRRL